MANKPKTNATAKGKDYFRVRVRIGDDMKGNPIYKNFYGTSKSDAEKKKREYLDTLAQGIDPDLSKQNLSRAMNTWLWEVERYNGNKSSTFDRYEGVFRLYIQDSTLGFLTLSDIKKINIQQYFNDLMFNQKKSYNQVNILKKLLNKFFSYAESESYIAKNPLKGFRLPKTNENDINEDEGAVETLTQDEINKVLETAGHTKIRYIISFALLSGARQGEILALEKSDLTDDVIKINKTVRKLKIFDSPEEYHYEIKTTTPKTERSIREIPINNSLRKELAGLKRLVAEEKLKLGEAYEDNNLLFPSSVGKYITAKTLFTSWKRLLKRAGVQDKKFHALRHTFATTLIMENVDLLTVSRLLGHGSIETTQIYTHVLKEKKQNALDVLNNKFVI